jgi:hypothetical protein
MNHPDTGAASTDDRSGPQEHRAPRDTDGAWGEIDLRVTYLLPHPIQDVRQASPFLGFTPGLLDIGPTLAHITQLPADALEPYTQLDKIIGTRALGAGPYRVLPVQIDALPYLRLLPQRPFACVFSTPEVISDVFRWIATQDAPVLHVSREGVGTVAPELVNFELVTEYIRRGLEWARANLGAEERYIVDRLLALKANARRAKALKLATREHNVTAPNELTLSGLGHKLGPHRPIDPRRPREFEEAIIKSFDLVIANRARSLRKPLPYVIRTTSISAVLWAPSVYAHLRGNVSFWRDLARKLGRKPAHLLKQFIVSRRQFAVEFEAEREELQTLGNAIAPALSVRKREIDTVVGATAVLCAGHCAGALRLSPGIESLWGPVRQLAQCARTPSTHRAHKLMRLGPKLAAQARAVIGDATLARLTRSDGHVKLLCDYPVEWTDIDGLPLGLRCELSRIPTVPGNVFLAETLNRAHMSVSRAALRDVLVIRAYQPGDRIAPILKTAVEATAGGAQSRVRVTFVDVHSEEEFIRALNSFSGALLIFDGHGVNLGTNNIAALMIGKQPVDPWSLRGAARIPPLVWLSACDTHPIDGSHASSGVGFLVAGARSVLATLLPLDAVHAAVIVGRMIVRLDEFLEVATGPDRPAIRWSSVVTGMLRMAYASDLIRFCCSVSGKTSEAVRKRIQFHANMWINSHTPGWFDRIVQELAEETGLTTEAVRHISRVHIAWSDVARYVQLGNPECVLVTA